MRLVRIKAQLPADSYIFFNPSQRKVFFGLMALSDSGLRWSRHTHHVHELRHDKSIQEGMFVL